MTILCPCCGRVTVKGLRKTTEEAISRLAATKEGISTDQLFAGRGIDPDSHPVALHNLRTRLASLGYQVVNVNERRGAGHRARYRLEKVG